jgi:MFS superfamily sulfate permease-like transporter
MQTKNSIPLAGIKGLKQNWKKDITTGFLVFLLALPLSLGIAKASGFPASMGVLSAIIGGVFTSLLKPSPLTIKGPAAGLITICAAAVIEFGGGEEGWKQVSAVIIVMAILQVLFGILKFGFLSDFFPHSVIHGMLAAIGIIIILKHIPILLGDAPALYNGEDPIELFLDIPEFIGHAHWHIAVVGIIGLLIMFVMPMVKINFFRKIPAPMMVLLLTIPLAFYWHFKETEPSYSLVSIGDFWGTLDFNADFSSIGTFTFWKYVTMFLFVSSLESILTVKAVDSLDPYHRISDYNADLKAQGAGNLFSGILGGMPMISEVVRSSSNVGFGSKTKWANFFHGIFLLLAMIFLIPIIETIPNAALAAMLIYAGYRLAAPKEFIHTYNIGKEQLMIFLITIIFTLAEDLLIGVAAGILTKLIIHLFNGLKFKSVFKAHYSVENKEDSIHIKILESAVFSNLIDFKKFFLSIPHQQKVIIDISETILIDHSFMSFINYFQNEYNGEGGDLSIKGLETHRSFSSHPLSTKKLIKCKN